MRLGPSPRQWSLLWRCTPRAHPLKPPLLCDGQAPLVERAPRPRGPGAHGRTGAAGWASDPGPGGGPQRLIALARSGPAKRQVMARRAPADPRAWRGAVVGWARSRDDDREQRADDTPLQAAMQAVAAEWPPDGDRRVTAQGRRQGWTVNHQRVGRLMGEWGVAGMAQTPRAPAAAEPASRSSRPSPGGRAGHWTARPRVGVGHHVPPVAHWRGRSGREPGWGYA